MKTTIALALASALALAGCASGPYPGYSGNVHYDDYRPYAYGPTYPYPDVYYGYPGSIGGTFYYDRRDYDHDRWNRRHYPDHDQWRGRRSDDRGNWRDRNDPRSREPLDTRHGEAGNEAGM